MVSDRQLPTAFKVVTTYAALWALARVTNLADRRVRPIVAITVTLRHIHIDGSSGVTGNDCSYKRRRSPATPYVNGLIRISQNNQPESPPGKNAPDTSHIGIKKMLMMA